MISQISNVRGEPQCAEDSIESIHSIGAEGEVGDDVCFVDIHLFKSRSTCFVSDPCIEQRYKQLLAKYECFNKVIYYHKNTCIKQSETHRSSRSAPRAMHNEKKCLKKTLTMLWNTLNEGNYTKISHRLRFIINEDNYKAAIKELIDMSILHSLYRRYFLHLLLDVIQIQSEKAKNYVYECIQKFDTSYWLLSSADSSMQPYEYFCKQQKHKLKVLHTIEFLIDITSLQVIDITILWIWETVLSACKTVPQGSHATDLYYIDLLLNCIMIIIEWLKPNHRKYDKHTIESTVRSMILYVDDIYKDYTDVFRTNMKLVFLREKVFHSLNEQRFM